MESKTTRLRRACDACSIRKVKCDETGPPCRSCAVLEIPCTYDRPSRRRGPPNRHVEALKKHRAEPDSTKASNAPTPSFQNLQKPSRMASGGGDASQTGLSGESICSLPTLQRLIDDFFTLIHPLIPVPHEPTFREAFARREDATNMRFLSLLAAMVGSLGASCPRWPKLHFQSDAERDMYPHTIALVKRCHDIAVQARGLGYLDTSNTVNDAAISYHLAVCAGYLYNVRRCRLYLAECITIVRVHGLHRQTELSNVASPSSSSSLSGSDDPYGVIGNPAHDYIQQELGRRLFYLCLVALQSMHQVGAIDGNFYIPPETSTDRYPALPREVDDEYILPTHVGEQPQGVVSQLTGFNANVRIFQNCNPLAALEIAFGTSEIIGWERQRQMIWECLEKTKQVIDELPRELKLNASSSYEMSEPSSTWSIPQWRSANDPVTERRRIQYEIQKANIYASQLATRSYLVDKYWNFFHVHKRLHEKSKSKSPEALSPGQSEASVRSDLGSDKPSPAGLEQDAMTHAQTDTIGRAMLEERGLVIRDLLTLLRNVREVHIEPNGASFTNKLRHIASTLLNLPSSSTMTGLSVVSDWSTSEGAETPVGPHPMSTEEADNYLRTFLDVLVRLEGAGATGVGSLIDPTGNEPEMTPLEHTFASTARASQASSFFLSPPETQVTQTLPFHPSPKSTAPTPSAPQHSSVGGVAPTTVPSSSSSSSLPSVAFYESRLPQEDELSRQWAYFQKLQRSYIEDEHAIYRV